MKKTLTKATKAIIGKTASSSSSGCHPEMEAFYKGCTTIEERVARMCSLFRPAATSTKDKRK